MPSREATSERNYCISDIGKMVTDYFSTVYPDIQVILNSNERLSASDTEVDSFLCEV